GLRLLSSCGGTPRSLPSFPTRRSSDLVAHRAEGGNVALVAGPGGVGLVDRGDDLTGLGDAVGRFAEAEQRIEVHRLVREQPDRRSEEHTSELQSRFDLVCRLLLEKKKN